MALTWQRVLGCGVLVAVGCTSKGDSASDSASAALAEISDLSVTPSALFPNIVTVAWTASEPGASWVEWGEGEAFDHQTPVVSSGSAVEVVVLGIPIDGDFKLRPVTETGGGRAVGETTELSLVSDAALPAITLETRSPGDDYVLFSLGDFTSWFQLIVNRDGAVVWYAVGETEAMGGASGLSRDGKAVLYNSFPEDMLATTGSVERVALDGSSASSISTPGQHHDFVELPDGRFAYLAVRVEDWAGEGTLGDEIHVTDGVTPTVAWSAWDTLVPYNMCSHFAPVRYGGDNIDWVHANSVRYDETNDAYWMMSRNLDALFSIDADTGQINWQLGGDDSDFSFVGDDPRFDHAHISDIWDDGLVLFDNGLHRDPQTSRVVEYSLDVPGRTATLVWEVPSDEFRETLGDVVKLDDGYLIGWSDGSSVSELDTDGVERWAIAGPDGYRVGHVTPISSLYEGR